MPSAYNQMRQMLSPCRELVQLRRFSGAAVVSVAVEWRCLISRTPSGTRICIQFQTVSYLIEELLLSRNGFPHCCFACNGTAILRFRYRPELVPSWTLALQITRQGLDRRILHNTIRHLVVAKFLVCLTVLADDSD